jgi:signal transduction histidine kinase
MMEHLRIAIKRQQKLLLLFFLTIFLPSVSLSIFGLRAIRNERFRLVKQTEMEDRRAAEFLKSRMNVRFSEVEAILKSLALNAAVRDNDWTRLDPLLAEQLGANLLIEHVFVSPGNNEAVFPYPKPPVPSALPQPTLDETQKDILQKAEDFEFTQKKPDDSIPLYKKIYGLTKSKSAQAQMLNNIGRCYLKMGQYADAVSVYSRISAEYPETLSASLMPLGLVARLQILAAYQKMGNRAASLKSALQLYQDLLEKPWALNEDQFLAYSAMIEEIIAAELAGGSKNAVDEENQKKLAVLRERHQKTREEWQDIRVLREEIIPNLRRRTAWQDANAFRPVRYAEAGRRRDYLIVAAVIPDQAGHAPTGIIGLLLNNDVLQKSVLENVVQSLPLSSSARLRITDFSGQVLYGNREQSPGSPSVTEIFAENFPPWRIEFFLSGAANPWTLDLRRSFYFWTILTLILVLTFGAVLIIRTVSHEMEVIKIKSDFVSSVSHEIKTPLTSIKALIERLQEGKIQQANKLSQYFSIIAQDTEKLSRLVKNILDFSKIEEGRKEYDFVETEMTSWLSEQVEMARKSYADEIPLDVQIAEGLPSLAIDQDVLSRALVNLIDNAVKFSPDRGEIQFCARTDGERIILEVIDHGIGIPRDELDKIFEKFYQGRNALDVSAKGTGLGLTLVKHALEAHGGRVTVESQPGRGARFSLVLPLRKQRG